MKKLCEYAFTVEESRIHLKSDSGEAILAAVREIRYQRIKLADYVKQRPYFQYALEPLEAPPGAPEIVRVMVGSSRLADVGPMASVAGALADLGLKAMLMNGAETAVVEDGGEIAAFTSQPVAVSVLSSNTRLSGKIGFRITSDDCPIGIATSSSKTGHALSFGEADSVTVTAINASLADAAATAICNCVAGLDIDGSIRRGVDRARTIKGVKGVIVVREDRTGLWGDLPQIVKVK